MVAKVGSLFVDLAANSAAFAKDLGKARKDLVGFTAKGNRALARLDKSFLKLRRSVAKTAKNFFSFRGAILTLAGGAGLGLLIKKNLEFADTIAKSADAIGIATKELQQYRFAADLAGVGTETLDKSLSKFNKNLGELKAGTGTLITILNKTSPALAEMLIAAKSTSAGLDLMFKAISQLGSASEKAALANAAFGRSGVFLVNMLKEGTEGLNAAKQAAIDYGIIIDEKVLRSSENAVDELTVLSTVLKRKVTVAIVENADEIANFATMLLKAIPVMAKFAGNMVKNVAASFNFVRKASLLLGAGILKLIINFGTLGKAVVAAVKAPFQKAGALIKAFAKDFAAFAREPLKGFKGANFAIELTKGLSSNFKEAFTKIQSESEKLKDAIDQSLIKQFEMMNDETIPQFENGTINTLANIARATRDAGEEMESFGKQAEAAGQKASEVFKNAAADIQKSVTGAFKTGFTGLFQGKGFNIKGLGKSIANIAATTAANVATTSISGLIGSLLGKLGGGGAGIGAVFGGVTGGQDQKGQSFVTTAFNSIANKLVSPVLSKIGTALGLGSGGLLGPAGSALLAPPGSAAFAGIAGGGGAAGGGLFGAGAGAGLVTAGIVAVAIPLILGAFKKKKRAFSGAVGVVGEAGTLGGIQSKASRVTTTEAVDAIFGGLSDFLNQVATLTGTEFAKIPISAELGKGADEFRIQLTEGFAGAASDIIKRIKFDPGSEADIQRAISDLTLELLTMSNVTGDLAIAIKNIETVGRTTTEVLNDLVFAANFANFGKLPIVLSQGEFAVIQLNLAMDAAAATAKRLGLEEAKVERVRKRSLKTLKEDFEKGITNQLQELLDPKQFALDRLEESFKNVRRDAFAFGADIADVEQLLAEKRVEILTEFGDQAISTFSSITSSVVSFAIEAKRLSDTLRVDKQLSGLSKQNRRTEALKQFEAARVGFISGTTEFKEVERTSRTLLDASMDFFSTTEGFYEDQAKVLGFLDGIESGSIVANDNTVRLVNETKTQTDILKAILEQTQLQLIAAQLVSPAQLLRTGQTEKDISFINTLNELPERLVRQFKVVAGFDFSTQQNQTRQFKEAVRAGEASGDLFNRLVQAVGGKTQTFANGGTGSGFAFAGERGIEAINLGTRARVMSANQTRAALNDNSDVVRSVQRLEDVMRIGVQATADQTVVLQDRLENLEEELIAIKRTKSRSAEAL